MDAERLRRLWRELLQLPVRQRAALLLNLRDAEGHGMIATLPLTGVATMREIAAALEMPAVEFAALWRDLPLEDRRIAELLAITRQQVINLRKCARERLARRLRGTLNDARCRTERDRTVISVAGESLSRLTPNERG